MEYQHLYHHKVACPFKPGKVVCVGRNYADHIKELNNPMITTPLLFMKPASAMVSVENPIHLSRFQSDCHYETEIAILIGTTLSSCDEKEAVSGIAAIGIALDLTLRGVQSELKKKGHPWEIAKAFDGACPISPFIERQQFQDLNNIQLSLNVNGQQQQDGNSNQMITPITKLIEYISTHFTLEPGDVVLTGTPAGVGELKTGDQLELILDHQFHFQTQVSE